MPKNTKSQSALVKALTDAGVDPKEVLLALLEGGQFGTPAQVLDKVESAVSAEDAARDAAEKAGYGWSKGRIYLSDDLEAAREVVAAGGAPVVVTGTTSLEDGRKVTQAVQVFRTSNGTVAAQRLYERKA